MVRVIDPSFDATDLDGRPTTVDEHHVGGARLVASGIGGDQRHRRLAVGDHRRQRELAGRVRSGDDLAVLPRGGDGCAGLGGAVDHGAVRPLRDRGCRQGWCRGIRRKCPLVGIGVVDEVRGSNAHFYGVRPINKLRHRQHVAARRLRGLRGRVGAIDGDGNGRRGIGRAKNDADRRRAIDRGARGGRHGFDHGTVGVGPRHEHATNGDYANDDGDDQSYNGASAHHSNTTREAAACCPSNRRRGLNCEEARVAARAGAAMARATRPRRRCDATSSTHRQPDR